MEVLTKQEFIDKVGEMIKDVSLEACKKEGFKKASAGRSSFSMGKKLGIIPFVKSLTKTEQAKNPSFDKSKYGVSVLVQELRTSDGYGNVYFGLLNTELKRKYTTIIFKNKTALSTDKDISNLVNNMMTDLKVILKEVYGFDK